MRIGDRRAVVVAGLKHQRQYIIAGVERRIGARFTN
jgi:hypothetical protein